MDILTRIRNTKASDLEGVPSTFDDMPKPVVSRRAPKDMIRVVEGADDLKVNRPAPKNPGMVKAEDWSMPTQESNNDTKVTTGASERQVTYITSLLEWLSEWDADGSLAMRDWLNRGGWGTLTGGKGGTASDLIDRIKARLEAKKAEVIAARRTKTTLKVSKDTFPDVPDGYYAVQDSGPDDWKFYRVSTGRDDRYAGRRFLKVQASDELHSVRNPSVYCAVFNTIRSMGVQESMAAYGQHIGRCGRCHRTLTDAESRAYGIGPDCRSKM